MSRGNNFDALRLLAALMVLCYHSVYLTAGNQLDWLWKASSGQMTSGRLGVAIFFVISGALITNSWLRRPDIGAFLWARLLRILPALAASVLMTVLVIGPLLSHDSHYWMREGTWLYFRQLLLHAPPHLLPGVFTDHSDRRPNGAVWTLEYEAFCYLMVAILGVTRQLDRRLVTTLAITLVVVFWRIPEVQGNAWLDVPRYFAAGAALTFWADRLPWQRTLALACLFTLVVTVAFGELTTMLPITGSYLVLYLARGTQFAGLHRIGDLSYGLYIYAMPIQQALIDMGLDTPLFNLVAAIPLTVMFSLTSWWLLERPFLAFKNRSFLAIHLPLKWPRWSSASTDY